MSGGTNGCIPSDMGAYNATCCVDGITGCAVGYVCEASNDDAYCRSTKEAPFGDELVTILPRYHLCRGDGLESIYGLKLDEDSNAQLAYYSSHGALERIQKSPDIAVVTIHGANRNGDDYFCSMNAAVELQNEFTDVLVISIQFYSEIDDRSRHFLYWEDVNDGAWRYGDNSLGPISISSFEAMDILVEKVASFLPSVNQIIIVGHSSGAQFAQRWSILTTGWKNGFIRAVVMNPSSYIYTWPKRLIYNVWQEPPDEKNCPMYNTWQWGLRTSTSQQNEYVLQHLADPKAVVHRYRSRYVSYLVGSQDRCNVTQGWCHSHGLEVTCMDELQGEHRLQRSKNYIASLRLQAFGNYHVYKVVEGVGHDHSLMFQSREGLSAIFRAEDLASSSTTLE